MVDIKASSTAIIVGVIAITTMYLAFIAVKLAIIGGIMALAYFIAKPKKVHSSPPGPSEVRW